jgi:CheY-like chemotaxis protein
MEGLLTRLIREDIEFRTEMASGALMVMGDRSQLEQVLINLVTNAGDSMPEGGALTLSLAQTEIDGAFIEGNGFIQAGSYAVITVADTGTGMDEETRERIFEPFYTTKGVGKGTGLGLAIVYGIVKQHNGYIRVASEPGEGAEFRVYLPLIEAQPVAQQPPPTGEPLEGSETVLLAEDEQTVRDLMRSILEEHGYTVLEAVNGMEAVEHYSMHRNLVDLLVMDVIMPKMNGKDAIDAIRRVSPDVKVLFTSGYTGDVLNNKGIEEEGLHFVAKPVVPRELLRKVRHILDS